MKITTVTYAATINLGNYESEKIEISAEVSNEDGDLANVLAALRSHIEANTVRPGWLERCRERATAGSREAMRETARSMVDADPFAGFPD